MASRKPAGKWDVDLRALEASLLAMDRSNPDFPQLMKLFMAAHWRSALGIREIEDDITGDGLLEEDEWVTFWTNMHNPDNPAKVFHSHGKFMMSEEMALLSFDWIFKTANKVFFQKAVVNKKGKVNMREADKFAQKCQQEWRKLGGNLQRFKNKSWYASIVKRESEIVYEEDLKDNEDEPPVEEAPPATEEVTSTDDTPQLSYDELEAQLRAELGKEYNDRWQRDKDEWDAEKERLLDEQDETLDDLDAEKEKTRQLTDELENARQQIAALGQGDQATEVLQSQLADKDNELQQEREKSNNLDAQNRALQEQLEQAQQKNEQLAQEKDAERNQMEQDFAAKMQESDAAMAELRAKLAELESGQAKADETNDALCECEKARGELTARVEELERALEAKTEEINGLNNQISTSADEIAALNQKIAMDEQNHQQEVERLQAEIDVLKNGQNDEALLAAQLSELKRQIAEKDNQLQEQNNEIEDLRGKAIESKNEQDRLSEELERLRQLLEESRTNHQATLKELTAAHQTIADEKAQNHEKAQQIEEMRGELEDAEETETALATQLANAQILIAERKRENDKLKEDIEALRRELEETRSQLTSAQETIAVQKNQIDDLNAEIERLRRLLEESRAREEATAKELQAAQETIENMKTEIIELKEEIERLRRLLAESQNQLTMAQQINEDQKADIDRLNEQIRYLESLRMADKKEMMEESSAQSGNDNTLLEQIRLLTQERNEARENERRLEQERLQNLQKIAALENANQQLLEQNNTLQAERDQARANEERLRQENEQNRRRIEELEREIERLKSQLKSANDTIIILRDRIAVLERQTQASNQSNANDNSQLRHELEIQKEQLQQLTETNERQAKRIARLLEEQRNDADKRKTETVEPEELVVMATQPSTDIYAERLQERHPVVKTLNVIGGILWVVWFLLYLLFVASNNSVVLQAVWYVIGLLAVCFTLGNLFYSCCESANHDVHQPTPRKGRHLSVTTRIGQHCSLLFMFTLCHLYFWFLVVGYFHINTNIDHVRGVAWLFAIIATYTIVVHFLTDAYPLGLPDVTVLDLSKWDFISPVFMSVAVGLICHGVFFAIDPLLRTTEYFSEIENLLVWNKENPLSYMNVVGVFLFLFVARPFVSQLHLRLIQYISKVFCQRMCIQSCGDCCSNGNSHDLLKAGSVAPEEISVEETAEVKFGLSWAVTVFSLVAAVFVFASMSPPDSQVSQVKTSGDWIWVIVLFFYSLFLFVIEGHTSSDLGNACGCGNRWKVCDVHHSEFISQLFVAATCFGSIALTVFELLQASRPASAVCSLIFYCVFNFVQWYMMFFAPARSLTLHSNVFVLLSSLCLHSCLILSAFVNQFQTFWSMINQNSTQWKLQSISSSEAFLFGFFFVSLEYHSQMISKIYSHISRI